MHQIFEEFHGQSVAINLQLRITRKKRKKTADESNLTVVILGRLRRVRVPGSVHVGDVHQGVRARSSHILRLELQSFRLRGHLGIDLRSDLVRGEVRLFRPLRPTCP